MSGMGLMFLALSILPGLIMTAAPWAAFARKRMRYSVSTKAWILSREDFTWLDSEHRTHPGIQLTYRYEAGGALHTWKGRPIHHVRGVPESGYVTLYVNPDDCTDVWEKRQMYDLWVTTAVGIALMAGGAAAALVYFL